MPMQPKAISALSPADFVHTGDLSYRILDAPLAPVTIALGPSAYVVHGFWWFRGVHSQDGENWYLHTLLKILSV